MITHPWHSGFHDSRLSSAVIVSFDGSGNDGTMATRHKHVLQVQRPVHMSPPKFSANPWVVFGGAMIRAHPVRDQWRNKVPQAP